MPDAAKDREALDGAGRAERPERAPAPRQDAETSLDALADAEALLDFIGRELDGRVLGGTEHFLDALAAAVAEGAAALVEKDAVDGAQIVAADGPEGADEAGDEAALFDEPEARVKADVANVVREREFAFLDEVALGQGAARIAREAPENLGTMGRVGPGTRNPVSGSIGFRRPSGGSTPKCFSHSAASARLRAWPSRTIKSRIPPPVPASWSRQTFLRRSTESKPRRP